jgi:NAD(P)-dependent dehydrogenase (short-subunit alcohol dehydrogenase family)
MGRFNGKSALVTGAGSGIGRAMALRLAADGASVVCADVNADGLAETVAMAAGGKAKARVLDVTDEAAFKGALQETAREHGRLDILMNNAGVAYKRWEPTQEVNLSGVYYGLIHACPLMAAQGGGAIVNTASVAGLAGLVPVLIEHTDPRSVERMAAYVASKHGVIGLTKQFAVSFGAVGVRVNAVCPGFVETPMTGTMRQTEEGLAYMTDLTPMGRTAKPEEIAAAAAFLASEDASFVTGVAMPVDGGYFAR